MNTFMINGYIANPTPGSIFVKEPVMSIMIFSDLEEESEVLMKLAKNPVFSEFTGSEYTLTCDILPSGFIFTVISI